MKKLKPIISGGPVEAAVAIVSFGGSSLYWLALAYAKSPAEYGHMMTVQASILIVVTIFTFRTHDLFFNLISQHGCPAETAYRRTLRIELTAGAAGTVICTLGALLFERSAQGAAGALGVATFALLASLAVIQGSTIGSLRYLTRGDVIAKTDMLASVAWAGACASIPLIRHQPPIVPLIIGSIPPAARTLALFAFVRKLLPGPAGPKDEVEAADEPPIEVRDITIVRFLAGAQIASFIKNANVSIETVVLAAFGSPALVGMYRVARAVQGASAPVLNVAYQRFYPIVARSKDPVKLRRAVRSLTVKSLIACLCMYPVSAAVSLSYSMLKPEVGLVELQLITFGTFLALLPAALQQGSFAILSLVGDHKSAGAAYILSVCVLGLTTLLLYVSPRIEFFMAGVIAAGIVRLWYMSAKSHRALSALRVPA